MYKRQLLALGIVAGPIGALAIQVVLNQTGLLNKLIDQHQLSFSQKEALKQGFTGMAIQRENGKNVNIEIEGVQTYCRLDLKEPTGVKIAGFKEFKSDRTFTDI